MTSEQNTNRIGTVRVCCFSRAVPEPLMRRVANPPNPFEARHVDYFGEPPRVEMEVYEEHAREILSHNDSPDLPFSWSINPYRGCQHACAYCYARPTHEYLGLGAGSDFDSKITVKVNAPELLETALARPKWRREPIVFSGVTDCYQPLEASYGLTRRCLEVCAARRNPVGIVTKSYLIVRDIDVLARLARDDCARVYISVAFADDAIARKIEPGAPTPGRRFDAMRQLSAAGVPVGVMVAPLIPGLNDRDVVRVLERARECGASWAGHTALRLPGHVKDVFLDRLASELPDRAARVASRIHDIRGGRWSDSRFGERMRGQGVYWAAMERLFRMTKRRLGFDSGSIAQPAKQEPASVQLPLFGR